MSFANNSSDVCASEAKKVNCAEITIIMTEIQKGKMELIW